MTWARNIVTFDPTEAVAAVASDRLPVQTAHGARHDDVPGVPIQPPGAYLERAGHLPGPAVSGGAAAVGRKA